MHAARIPIDWNEHLSVYASEKFLKAVANECGWLGGTDATGRLRCVLPYTVIRKAGVRMARFRVETIQCAEPLSIEEEKAFLGEVVSFFRNAGVALIIPASTNAIFRTYPERAAVAPYGTLVVDLSQSEDALFRNLSASHRRKVQVASREGVKIRSGREYMETAYTQVKETFQRSSIPFMKSQDFEKMVVGLGENVRIYVADYHGCVQGCAVVPFSIHSAYYMYGGSVLKPVTGAMHLMHWEAMMDARRLGVKRYDFSGVRLHPVEGSKQAGLRAFKERFGPSLIQGYMWKYKIIPAKAAVYSLAVRLLRGGDIVDAESHNFRDEGQPGASQGTA